MPETNGPSGTKPFACSLRKCGQNADTAAGDGLREDESAFGRQHIKNPATLCGAAGFLKTCMKNLLLDKYFLLSYDVNAFGEAVGSTGACNVAADEHAVGCVDINGGVAVFYHFNIRYVVYYAVNADCLVNRAAEVLHFRYVDIASAAGNEYALVGAYVEHGVLEIQAGLAFDVYAFECTDQTVVYYGRRVGYCTGLSGREVERERLLAVFIGLACCDDYERLAGFELCTTVHRLRRLRSLSRCLQRKSLCRR